MPIITFDDTLGCLDVEHRGGGHYFGPNIEMPYYRIFGGQLLAQAIAIAAADCAGKQVKSLHATFPRAGDLREPVDYHVQRVQDGRTFSNRWIVGSQSGRPIVCASLALHVPEEGIEHQIDAPDVGGPEKAEPVDLSMIPWETRVVGGVDLESRDVGPARYEFWMRAPLLPNTVATHQALLAHSTDLTLIGTTLRPHAELSEADSPDKLQTAVSSHTIWFHRPARIDDWVLISQQSPAAAAGRGFGFGHAFTESGSIIASFAQESVIRELDRGDS